jgi:hypothetical protein
MRLFVGLLATIAVLTSTPARAQDLSGLYSGLHAGYSVVKPKFTEPLFDPVGLNPAVTGLTGGGLLGYRRGKIGFEGEIGLATLAETRPGDGGDGFTKFEAEWLSRARVTLSHASGRTLFFAAAGLSAMSFFVDDAYIDDTAEEPLQHGPALATLAGWNIGAGVERSWRERLALMVEAIHDRFAGKDVFEGEGAGSVEPAGTTIRFAVVFRY